MKKSKLETKKDFIAGALAAGIPQTEIAKQLQVNQSTISRLSNKEDVRAAIEEQGMSLMGVLTDAVDNIKSEVNGMKYLPVEDHKGRDRALKASMRVLEAGGLLNSATQSSVVISITKEGNQYINPIVDEILRQHTAPMSLDDITPDEG